MIREDVLLMLNDYKYARREYKRLLLLLEETETKIEGLSAIDYSRVKVQTTPDFDKLSGSIDKLNDIRNQCIEMAHIEINKMQKALDLINLLDDVIEKDALTRYFIYDHTWERVAYEMNIPFRTIMRTRKRGLHNISKKVTEKEK